MTSEQEIFTLPMALMDNDGRAICEACVPFVGSKAPYIRNWNAAPALKLDDRIPLLSSCPECYRKYQTPVVVALFALLERVKRLEGAA